MDEVTNRWRSEMLVDDSYWVRNRTLLIQIFVTAVVLLLLALGWISYMRFILHKRDRAERALNDQLEFIKGRTPAPDDQAAVRSCEDTFVAWPRTQHSW